MIPNSEDIISETVDIPVPDIVLLLVFLLTTSVIKVFVFSLSKCATLSLNHSKIFPKINFTKKPQQKSNIYPTKPIKMLVCHYVKSSENHLIGAKGE